MSSVLVYQILQVPPDRLNGATSVRLVVDGHLNAVSLRSRKQHGKGRIRVHTLRIELCDTHTGACKRCCMYESSTLAVVGAGGPAKRHHSTTMPTHKPNTTPHQPTTRSSLPYHVMPRHAIPHHTIPHHTIPLHTISIPYLRCPAVPTTRPRTCRPQLGVPIACVAPGCQRRGSCLQCHVHSHIPHGTPATMSHGCTSTAQMLRLETQTKLPRARTGAELRVVWRVELMWRLECGFRPPRTDGFLPVWEYGVVPVDEAPVALGVAVPGSSI